MPEGMIFLPDDSELELSGGVGIVAAPVEELQRLAAAAPGLQLDEPVWRGMIAFCLLADAWGDDCLRIKTIQPESSGFVGAVLDGPVQLVLLERNDKVQALGCLHPQVGVIPAAQMAAYDLPAWVRWYDGGFCDPVDMLDETQRSILIRRLSALRHQGEGCVQRFVSALTQVGMRAAQAVAHQEPGAQEALLVRLKAILGEPPGVTKETVAYTDGKNPLLAALELEEKDEAPADLTTWSYHGVPFARSSSALYAEGTGHPGEAAAMETLGRDVALLGRYSLAWRRELLRKMYGWVATYHGDRTILPAVQSLMDEALRQLSEPVPQETLHLTWPWENAGVERILWHEALGEELDEGMAAPFADRLCLLPGGAWTALGDAVLSRLCVLPGDTMTPPCGVIPPLSATLAACSGASLIQESFVFRRREDGCVSASFALRGQDMVVLERIYAPEEIRTLTPSETPTLAVWPALPLPEESWRAYYVYIHGGTLQASALQDGTWRRTEDRLFSIMKTEAFPAMIALHEGKHDLGVIPNQLPPCRPAHGEQALGLMEIGASGVSMALRQGNAAEPVRVAGLVRTLLQGAKAAPLSREFLPNLPLGPVLPAAVELFNQKDDPQPLVDGHILMPEGAAPDQTEDQNLHCAWKWSVDEASRRARRLMVHQAMLTMSLAAVMQGAPGIAWRIALPEGMAADGRRALWQEVTALAGEVSAQCGLPLTDPVVTHADESMALGAYLRAEGGIRGGFMALDVGSADVSMALWLRGMNRPAVRCNLPLGVQSMLLDALMQAPDVLENDFADLQDEAAHACVMRLHAALRSAATRKTAEKCRFLLDQCLTEHGHTLSMHMMSRFHQGRTTVTQSLIFQGFAATLAISGLVLEQVRRDPLLNDYLPVEMTYVLTGRGSQLMGAMPESIKAALSQFVRMEMSRDHTVQSLRFLFSTAPRSETVLGLARMSEVHADAPGEPQSFRSGAPLHMPPNLIIMQFLSAFRSVFPQACQEIYGPLFDQAGMIAPQAEAAIRATAARHFAAGAAPEAALAACMAELRTLRCENSQ